MNPGIACRRLGGVATTARLLESGCTRRSLGAGVSMGVLVRARRGTYALATLPPEALEALTHGGPLCCSAAARSYGLWVLDPDSAVHVLLGPNGRRHGHAGCRCVTHREPAAPEDRWRVGLVDALAQMRRCHGEEAFFAALESALRKDLLPRGALAALRRRTPKRHRWLIDFARDDADSGLESLLRLRLHRLGIRLQTQVRIGPVGVVDFVVGDCLILETDGETHGGENRHRDLVRDAIAASLGFTTLRFDYAMVLYDWPLVEDAILAALRRRLHLSTR